MKDDDKQTLTPKLRFPEFRDAPGWNCGELCDLTDVVRGGSPRPIDDYITVEPDGLNWLKIGDVPKDSKYITKTEQKVLKTALSKTREILPGDFILSNSMSFGRPYLTKIRTCIHDGWIAVTSLPDSLNRDFLYYSMMSDASQRYFDNQAAGGGVRNLTVDIVKLLPVYVPSSAEQRKIAGCLGSLDELIAAEGRKLEALRAHKKGLMQHLFPREGETRPRLRFPEFHDSGEWEEKELGEVTSAVFDGTHQTPTYTAEGIPFYSVENLISGSANKFISQEDYQFATRKNKPEKGDILLTRIGKIGFSQVVTWNHEFSVYVTLAVIKQSPICDSYYLHYFFQSDRYQTEIRSKSLQNAVPPKINLDSLRSTKVLVAGRAEQQRIAGCLSALDAVLAGQSQQLAALKTHKQALMQQLFPSGEA